MKGQRRLVQVTRLLMKAGQADQWIDVAVPISNIKEISAAAPGSVQPWSDIQSKVEMRNGDVLFCKESSAELIRQIETPYAE